MEALLARFCAPAMAGIKASNLAVIDKRRLEAFDAKLHALRGTLAPCGIRLEILSECADRAAVLVFRPQVLDAALRCDDTAAILTAFGYPPDAPLETLLARLKSRLHHQEYPHEIGAFLGYPARDVCGFLRDRRKGVLLVGEWKVYADAAAAEKRFDRYAACRKAVIRRLQHGDTLADIFGQGCKNGGGSPPPLRC